MKSLIAFLSLFLAVSFLACQDTRDGVQTTGKADYYRTVGEQIPFETGIDWIENYRTANNGESRTGTSSGYSVPASQLKELLASVSDVVGVAFHYGVDESGKTHIILVPVDPSLSLWTSIPGRIYVDANTGTAMSQSLAQTWTTSYENAHPSSIQFHFFGANIFDEIQAIPYFESIDVEQGIDLLNLTPELLLVVWNTGLLSGRTAGEEATVYDASNPCPPCDVK